ncbi:LysM peptidoglycan-binding domain-containing protein [Brevibacterium litoralis]|uniref:LysM peptidoglycan-binding domain-containing protein n=1 Tax=Brevibacterium litoralis TaxID=3138935 RepID=UPI0032EC67F9
MSSLTASPLASFATSHGLRTHPARERAAVRWTPRGRRFLRLARTLLLAAVFVGVVLAAVLGLRPDAAASGSAEVGAFDTVVVEQGDSLWTVAREAAGDRDVRDVVLAIVELNGLSSQIVHPGQELAVPSH